MDRLCRDVSPATPLPHLPSVQALRGFATIGVLVAHLHMMERKYSPDHLIGSWADIGHWGVDIFFVISGFIMVYVTWNAPRGIAILPRYYWRRATRIYPLYWIVSLAVLAVWLWRPNMVFSSNDPSLWRSFALFPQRELPLLAVGWTLVYEMYFYIAFGAFLVVDRRWIPLGLALWASGVCLGWVLLAPDARMAVLHHVLNPLTLEFIGGALFGWAYVRGGCRARPRLALAALLISISCLVAVFLTQDDLIAFAGSWELRVGFYGIAALTGFAGVLLSGLGLGRISLWLGDISYSLYLTHVLSRI